MRTRRAIRILRTTVLAMAMLCGMAEATEAPFSSAQGMGGPGRFKVLNAFRGEAVLDEMTQLIWERAPSPTEVTWATAGTRCALKSVGGHTSWRLPSFFELMTLVDPSTRSLFATPTLPAGHPFHNVKAEAYWTIDSLTTEPAKAYAVDFSRGDVASHQKHQVHPLWCVRGGAPSQPQTSHTNRGPESI